MGENVEEDYVELAKKGSNIEKIDFSSFLNDDSSCTKFLRTIEYEKNRISEDVLFVLAKFKKDLISVEEIKGINSLDKKINSKINSLINLMKLHFVTYLKLV